MSSLGIRNVSVEALEGSLDLELNGGDPRGLVILELGDNFEGLGLSGRLHTQVGVQDGQGTIVHVIFEANECSQDGTIVHLVLEVLDHSAGQVLVADESLAGAEGAAIHDHLDGVVGIELDVVSGVGAQVSSPTYELVVEGSLDVGDSKEELLGGVTIEGALALSRLDGQLVVVVLFLSKLLDSFGDLKYGLGLSYGDGGYHSSG